MRRWPAYTAEAVSRLTRAQIFALIDEGVSASDVIEFNSMEEWSRWAMKK